ncbi:hydrogenase small subunit [Corynebacterium frankenforstense]|uniref:hydrogenase small subunit n=1 Tax=Corynebacterium frankenforstense TaxID=1230998 RepID=UPI00254D8927|nr:hydrogenase small subunit [Corynebacterium frankenforstense]MDK6259089.1 hydrogenase small subunit [Corynebacterium frankenforstense]
MDLAHVWRGGTLLENLERQGVKRRNFMQLCAAMAGLFAVGRPDPAYADAEETDKIAEALGGADKPLVAWLQLQECTGCTESLLRSGSSTVEDLVLNQLSMNYNELIMAAAGTAADEALYDMFKEPHILVVNGSVPTKENGAYCTIAGKSAEQILLDAAENATVVLAVGACAVWGSVQAANPNPSGAVGVDQIIKDKPVIQVAGCPPIGEVITATITYLLTYGKPPEVDSQGRPKFAYDQRIHDSCERRPHFDAGQFVRAFDDEGARNGWCLYEVGCKGPSTYAPCPIVQWNMKTSWPIGAGHPCIGCTEKDFFDKFTPFYEVLPNIPGLGVEASAEKIGLGLLGVAGAGVAVHGAITAFKTIGVRRESGEVELLAAFGDDNDKQPAGATATTIDDAASPGAGGSGAHGVGGPDGVTGTGSDGAK